MAQPCHTIASHHRSHWDEVVARVIFQKYGDHLFPGASEAKLVFWKNGDTPDGRPASAWEAEGVIPIGVGHGRFDEHLATGGRIPKECATTLVVKAFGIFDGSSPEFYRLILFTLATDEGPAQHPFDVSGVLKAIHKRHPENPEIGDSWAVEAVHVILTPKGESFVNLGAMLREMSIDASSHEKLVRFAKRVDTQPPEKPDHPFDIMAISRKMPDAEARIWLTTALVALRDGQLEFTGSAIEFARHATILEVDIGKRFPFRIATIESENERIASFARSSLGCEAAIVIQRHPRSGITQISTDHRKVMQELADEIARSVIAAEPQDGGQWYYHEKARAVLNGSSSHPDVTPSQLSLDTIQEIVERVVKASSRKSA
ncbi:MAG: hypothetical protein AAB407_00640 [Patescibacteria group bacterium]